MNNIKDYFYFTKSERKGALVLTSILMLTLLMPFFIPFIAKPPKADLQSFQALIDAYESRENQKQTVLVNEKSTLFNFDPNTISKEQFIKLGLSAKTAQTIINYRNKGGKFKRREDFSKIYALSENDYERLAPFIQISQSPSNKRPDKASTILTDSVHLFEFDPNTIDLDQLIELGISPKTAQTIINYREKGGRFNDPEDLSKIYGLKDYQLNQLLPYVSIVAPNKRDGTKKTLPPTKFILDINKATAEDWERLKGIGPAYAKRIVKFREKLGGFYAIHQISETYGLPDSTFQKIKSQLEFSGGHKRIYINSISQDSLIAHPYISKKQGEVLYKFLLNHGPLQNANDFSKIRVFSENEIAKLIPYLIFE